MKQTTIFILDDEESIAELIHTFLEKGLPNNPVIKSFTNAEALLNDPILSEVDLFILDVRVNDYNGIDICNTILQKGITSTFLFISGFDYNYDSFIELKCTYDFIQKPFTNLILVNRSKTLINLSKSLKKMEQTKKRIEINIKDIFDYSDTYLLILDENMMVKLCSSKLANDLGFSLSDDIIGKCWADFLPDEMQPLKELFSPEKKTIFQEFTNDIVTLSGNRISIKWFNTRIQNGKIWTFSIGIPLARDISKEKSIEEMRSHWENIIKQDRTTINVFRELLDEPERVCENG